MLNHLVLVDSRVGTHDHSLSFSAIYRPDEAELFSKSVQHAYKQFRDKAAFSRSMTVRFILNKLFCCLSGHLCTSKLP